MIYQAGDGNRTYARDVGKSSEIEAEAGNKDRCRLRCVRIGSNPNGRTSKFGSLQAPQPFECPSPGSNPESVELWNIFTLTPQFPTICAFAMTSAAANCRVE